VTLRLEITFVVSVTLGRHWVETGKQRELS
ncbi:unnamed protein product, partial [Allacma fusca]